MCKTIILFVIVLLSANKLSAQKSEALSPRGLMCDLAATTNYQSIGGYPISLSKSKTPTTGVQSLLIYNRAPAFSWELKSAEHGVMQVAYQLLLSDDLQLLKQDKGNIWDSGKVATSKSTGVLYAGTSLQPNSTYYWKLKVWDNKGKVSPYSTVASFVTAPELSVYQNPAYPLQITDQTPVSLKKMGVIYQADFGKDAFGQLKLQLYSKTGGDTVTVRIGEVLDKDGNIERKPAGTIRYAQYLLVLQKGLHTYKINIYKDGFNTRAAAIKMPDYIGEVTPFRYAEIEGYDQPLNGSALTRMFVHYKFDDESTYFRSSDSTLNSIWDLCKYSIKATSFLGIYVDGDRERIPYEADAYINQLSHYAVDKEFTIARNSHEYLIQNPTWPTEWNLQSVLMAWNDYLYTGDIRSVAYHYESLQAKTLLALSDSTGLISTLNGKMNNQVKLAIHLVNGNLKDIVDWPLKSETDGFVFTKHNAVVNAFHYRTLVVMEKIATDLGKINDAGIYRKKAAEVKSAFHRMFFDDKRNIFVDGIGTSHASLHGNAFALALGLVDAKYQKTVMDFIKSRGMACSVYGSQFLLDGIYDANEGEYGLSLLIAKTNRSWYNMMKVGSTITLEAWDNQYKPNQDWNHAWGAAPANIISRKLMGVMPLKPGWSTFIIKPQIANLRNAAILVPTIKGAIAVTYTQDEHSFTADVEIPANTSAEVYLPIKVGQNFQVYVNGLKVKTKKLHQTALISNVGSGKHSLKIEYLKAKTHN